MSFKISPARTAGFYVKNLKSLCKCLASDFMNRDAKLVASLAKLKPAERHDELQKYAVDAIRRSIVDGNINDANWLLSRAKLFISKPAAREALIKYCSKWGRLVYSNSAKVFHYDKLRTKLSWTTDYARKLKQTHWKQELPTTRELRFVDVNREIRSLLANIKKKREAGCELFHAALIDKLETTLANYAFDKTSNYDQEEQRANNRRTLFDDSVAQITARASKYAKQRPDH